MLRTEAKVAGEDEASFKQITDLAVDAEGNIYVADAGKGVIKVYRKDGYYLGELPDYEQAGKKLPLGKVSRLAASRKDGAVYAIVPGPKRNTSRLVKFDGWETARTLWTKDFQTTVRALTVDDNASPRLVWTGDKVSGRAALRRIEDLGDRSGAEKVVGVGKPDALRRPGALAVDLQGNLIVYDITRDAYLKFTRTAPDAWKPSTFLALSRTAGFGWLGGLSKTLHIDQRRGHVYVAHPMGYADAKGWYLHRWDMQKKPIPFASTGTNRVRLRGTTRAIAVDSGGNIYLTTLTSKVIRKEMRPLYQMSKQEIQEAVESVESEGPYPQIRRSKIGWAHVDVLSPDGSLKKKTLISPHGPTGVGVDSGGGIYVMDSIYNLDFGKVESAGIRNTNSDIGSLVKFGPKGGWRGRDELWTHKGISPVNGIFCGCCTGYMTVDLDDRVFVADTARFQVKVLDSAGNIITYIGTYGNRDCAGAGSKYPKPEIPFRGVAGVAVAGDEVFVADDLNKRIARCILTYQTSRQVPIK